MFSQPSYITSESSDRLIDPASLPQNVPVYDVHASDDIMDERNNPTAQMFDQMISRSAQEHRQRVIAQMHNPAGAGQNPPGARQAPPAPGQAAIDLPEPQDLPVMAGQAGQPWFAPSAPANPTDYSDFHAPQVVTPGASQMPAIVPSSADPTADDQALLAQAQSTLQGDDGILGKLHTVMPLSAKKGKKTAKGKGDRSEVEAGGSTNQAYVDYLASHGYQLAPNRLATPAPTTPTPPRPATDGPMTAVPDPAILELASNDDLSVATIARQAEKSRKQSDDNEVVISLR